MKTSVCTMEKNRHRFHSMTPDTWPSTAVDMDRIKKNSMQETQGTATALTKTLLSLKLLNRQKKKSKKSE